MDIGLVGDGPAVDAIEAALRDVDVNVMPVAADLLDGFDAAAVVATAGDDAFRAADAAVDDWVAVEIGGVGGHGLASVDAAVSLFSDACYDCLHARVAAGDPETAEPRGVRSAVRYAGALAGRRLIRLLSGEDVGDTVVEVPGRERPFLPVPDCECAPERDRSFERGFREVPLEDAVARADRAVDDLVGPVREVGERESFPVPYYVAATADTRAFGDARAAEHAAGVAVDWNAGLMKALGEALERYAAGVYRADRFDRAPVADRADAVPPERFVAPDDGGPAAGDGSAAADAALPWVPGTDLGADEPVALPAEFVHYPPPERRFKPAITTGLGLGNSTAEATLSGLYETIERDATMLAWYSTFEPLELAVDDERYAALAKRARAEGLSATPLLVTQDVDVPVVAVGVHRGGEWPRFAAGSAADLDPAAAAADALAEALQNWTELRAMGPDAAADEGGAIGHHADFPAETRAFFDPEGSLPADTLGDAALAGEAELDAVVEAVTAAGLDAYAARTTTRDLEALGFEAVRALVPGAQPLFTGDPFFGERAREVPGSMGFEPRLDREYHPFP